MNIDINAELLEACKDARDAIAYLTSRCPDTTYNDRVELLDKVIKKAEPPTYQKVRDLDGTSGVVYEVRIDGEYVAHFKKLADVKRCYPNAVKRGDD